LEYGKLQQVNDAKFVTDFSLARKISRQQRRDNSWHKVRKRFGEQQRGSWDRRLKEVQEKRERDRQKKEELEVAAEHR
jgi:hypothetical protein